MKTVSVLCVAAALMLGVAGPATAAVTQTEGLALEAINNGNWNQAEAELRSGLAETPNDPMKLLNLAFVLQKSGRADEAAGIYQQVLQHKANPLVAIGSSSKLRPARAKQLAKRGMAALEK